jgi:hypothetical protein
MIFVRYSLETAYLPSPLYNIGYHFFASIVPTSGYMFLFDLRPEADRRILRTSSTVEVFESLENLKRFRRKTLSLA